MQFSIKLLSPDTCTRVAWPRGIQGSEADNTGLMAEEEHHKDGLGVALLVLERDQAQRTTGSGQALPRAFSRR